MMTLDDKQKCNPTQHKTCVMISVLLGQLTVEFIFMYANELWYIKKRFQLSNI